MPRNVYHVVMCKREIQIGFEIMNYLAIIFEPAETSVHAKEVSPRHLAIFKIREVSNARLDSRLLTVDSRTTMATLARVCLCHGNQTFSQGSPSSNIGWRKSRWISSGDNVWEFCEITWEIKICSTISVECPVLRVPCLWRIYIRKANRNCILRALLVYINLFKNIYV